MITEKLAALFDEYDEVTSQIAKIDHVLNTDQYMYPSRVMDRLTELYDHKWRIRRAINSAYTEMEQQKSLWRRIFKK